MVKTRVKGNKNRLKCIKELQEQGWEVGVVERTGKWVFPKDLWNLFDLVCVKDNKFKFIQVKSNYIDLPTKKGIEDFNNLHHNQFNSYEIWCYKDYEKQPTLLVFDEMSWRIENGGS